MKIAYFKRFRMEIDLAHAPLARPLPPGFSWVAWDESLVERHAEVKHACFQDEIDATVFPSLSHRSGCVRLMTEIRRKAGFLPEATWLIADGPWPCATVQGVRERNRVGSIQNLGVVPSYRGRGLGAALLLQALAGFRRAGLDFAVLEVTAQNEAAVRLYRRMGFRCRKTTYKAVETNGVVF